MLDKYTIAKSDMETYKINKYLVPGKHKLDRYR